MNILIGADPELFVRDKGSIISGFGLIKGDKQDPFPVKNGAVQVDGMALEFNINPAKDEAEFTHNINSVMDQLKAMVPQFEVVAQPTAHFTEEYMKLQPEGALELGCDPDFNAWNCGRVNDKPDQNLPMRTGAGHIHIGWCDSADIGDPSHLADCMEVIKQMDSYLGCASLLFDKDEDRRRMYGQAGAFRPKSYGVEYRVLSNYWLSSPELISFVYRTAIKAMKDLVEGKVYHKESDYRIAEVINTSDELIAGRVVDALGLEVPNV